MKSTEPENKEDKVNHPSHYTTDCPVIHIDNKTINIECIDVIRNMPCWKASTIKYVWRAGLKKEQGYSGIDKEIEDLEKAMFYVKDRIKQLKALKQIVKIDNENRI